MLNYENFVISLGRALEILRARPDAIPEQKTALRNLVALTKLGGATLTLAQGTLRAADRSIPPSLPGVRTLMQQMDAHGVEEIRVARHASAADLLNLLRALAVNLGGYQDGGGVAQRLRDAQASSVSVVTVGADKLQTFGRAVSVTEAFEAAPILEAAGETAHEGPAPPAEPVRQKRSSPVPAPAFPPSEPLEAALARLDADFAGPKVLDLASEAGREIAAAIADDRIADAVHALGRIVRLEAGLPDGSAKRSLAIVLKRLLTAGALRHVADGLFFPDRRPDALIVLRRAGSDATELLIQRLGAAETMHERRTYFDALREMGDTLREVLHLLEDQDWRVVRNVAELVGEAGVEDAAPRLGRLLRHGESRVRRAAAVAMARIGTAATADHLRRALREGDSEIRALVAGAVEGRKSSALAMPLALAAEEETEAELQREYYRALGRIGTPDALQALIKAVQPGGRFIGRKPAGPRLAAIEGLRLAPGPVALGTLEGLTRDGDRQVRQAAKQVLEGLEST